MTSPVPRRRLTAVAAEVGQTVAFAATTSGGTAAPIEHAWDLDGDGEFDDAVGARAQTSFAAEGS
jgi:hypothetical protein